jgi:hypothetical protein
VDKGLVDDRNAAFAGFLHEDPGLGCPVLEERPALEPEAVE